MASHLHLSGDGADRGFRQGEVLYFSFGEYSNYTVSTVVIVERDVPPSEISDAVEALPVRYNDDVRRAYAYRWHGDFVDAMVTRKAFRRVKVSEVYTDCDVSGHSGIGMLCLTITDQSD